MTVDTAELLPRLVTAANGCGWIVDLCGYEEYSRIWFKRDAERVCLYIDKGHGRITRANGFVVGGCQSWEATGRNKADQVAAWLEAPA